MSFWCIKIFVLSFSEVPLGAKFKSRQDCLFNCPDDFLFYFFRIMFYIFIPPSITPFNALDTSLSPSKNETVASFFIINCEPFQ